MLISIKRLMEIAPEEATVEESVLRASDRPEQKKPVVKLVRRSDKKRSDTKSDPLAVTVDCYRSSLRAVGKSAVDACSASGNELEQQLTRLVEELPAVPAPAAVELLESAVELELNKWASETAEYLREKADGVKEILMTLARTAESVGERDHRYANQFSELTADLRAIANLDDLTQVRASLVRKATELKSCVDTMTQESQSLITGLQSQVVVYENKLKSAEEQVLKDNLTGIANRRAAEKRMEWHIAQSQIYSVAVIDLNRFKQVNDQYGHAAGDDLLKQFAHEFENSLRKTDLVARWGGDEFVAVLNCDLAEAERQVERIHKWALGEYTLVDGASGQPLKVDVTASIGVAEWQAGDSIEQVIARADARMYTDKEQSRKR